MGIGVYNEECRKIVMRYAHEWERTITRSGRWIDFRHDYKTLDLKFIFFVETFLISTVFWLFSPTAQQTLLVPTSNEIIVLFLFIIWVI